MGGAASHGIQDGILDPASPDFEWRYWALRRMNAMFWVLGYSWWAEEMPNEAEYAEAEANLEQAGWHIRKSSFLHDKSTDCRLGSRCFTYEKVRKYTMSTVPKTNAGKKMTTTIQGHEVVLYFADEPNPQVAVQVQQALLGAYFPSKR